MKNASKLPERAVQPPGEVTVDTDKPGLPKVDGVQAPDPSSISPTWFLTEFLDTSKRHSQNTLSTSIVAKRKNRRKRSKLRTEHLNRSKKKERTKKSIHSRRHSKVADEPSESTSRTRSSSNVERLEDPSSTDAPSRQTAVRGVLCSVCGGVILGLIAVVVLVIYIDSKCEQVQRCTVSSPRCKHIESATIRPGEDSATDTFSAPRAEEFVLQLIRTANELPGFEKQPKAETSASFSSAKTHVKLETKNITISWNISLVTLEAEEPRGIFASSRPGASLFMTG